MLLIVMVQHEDHQTVEKKDSPFQQNLRPRTVDLSSVSKTVSSELWLVEKKKRRILLQDDAGFGTLCTWRMTSSTPAQPPRQHGPPLLSE
jgi:hypothetical protein